MSAALTVPRRILLVGGGGREHALAWLLAAVAADVLVGGAPRPAAPQTVAPESAAAGAIR